MRDVCAVQTARSEESYLYDDEMDICCPPGASSSMPSPAGCISVGESC